MIPGDDNLIFAEESGTAAAPVSDAWKILIVDDEAEVHHITKLVLANFQFAGRRLEFLSAYSSVDAVGYLEREHDIAVILLDVVMETDDAGLRLVKYIRNDLGNNTVRIILRTGQPGQAPESRVILEYDINDYKEKTELTAQKLYTAMIAAIRSYKDIITIEKSRIGLHKIIESSASIFELQSLRKFASGVLEQLTGLINVDRDAMYLGMGSFTATREGDGFVILAGTGRFENGIDQRLETVLHPEQLSLIQSALQRKSSSYAMNHYIGYIETKTGSQNLIFLEDCPDLSSLDIELINIYCINVAVAFDNIYLNREIEDNHRELIFTLGDIVEQRSMETGRHVKRVSEYARLLGELAGLAEEQVKLIQVASAVHDIGKVAIPDVILNKASRLDEPEFNAMKEHTVIGSHMLHFSRRELFQAAAIISLQHHERWDGTGYPAGLKGEAIHQYARITSIADVFDALTNNRVYRTAWSIAEAAKYIEDNSGSQFDPELVKLFSQHIGKFLEIQASFP
ncbi:MAG: DUF3369 domain-containing protein [Spirochaetes bacterium]|nr:DUF3369 domain-containing protein [Spirochaetota bacterium]MBU0954973.1 DUF3369 domain-containing protein [Spirochaetota bacterium]